MERRILSVLWSFWEVVIFSGVCCVVAFALGIVTAPAFLSLARNVCP